MLLHMYCDTLWMYGESIVKVYSVFLSLHSQYFHDTFMKFYNTIEVTWDLNAISIRFPLGKMLDYLQFTYSMYILQFLLCRKFPTYLQLSSPAWNFK